MIGLVADPGLPADVVDSIGQELPGLLGEWCQDSSVADRWRVETSSQLLPLDEDGALPLLDIGRRQRQEQGWDLTVVMTELPRRAGRRPIVADCQPGAAVGLVSVPAMGALGVRRRARDTVACLISEYLWNEGADGSPGEPAGGRRGRGPGYPVEVITGRDEERADAEEHGGEQNDIQRDPTETSVHLALTGTGGRLRLLAGMVRANRPWRLVPSLSPALAGAAAGAAFGVFYSNIWQLADAFSVGRLMLVNTIAVLAMITWLIFDNNLWENLKNRRLRSESALYNTVTVLTVSYGVLCMYVLLYSVTLVAAFVTIPTGYLATTLGHGAGVSDLATVAWLSASMGTIAGALGSGLAGAETVRRAAYSAREQERQERRDAEEERTDREATRAEENES